MSEEQKIIELYRKRAKHYDFTANLYYLLGYREYSYRKKAIRRLHLSNGHCVVDLACGTGLNFDFIVEKIGSEGKLIGVDLTDGMLEKAKERIQKKNWTNVDLNREVWKSVEKYFQNVEYREFFLCVSYLVHGQKIVSEKNQHQESKAAGV